MLSKSEHQRHKMRAGQLLVSLLLLCITTHSVVGSNSRDVCRRDPPDTAASKTPGDNGFRIKISGNPTPERYTPGQVYTVSINGTYSNQRLLGFMLVAVPLNAHDETTTIGTFQHLNSGTTKFADACYWVVQQTYWHQKAGVQVLWTAPPKGTGCVEFRATVVEYKDIWYKDDGALTRVFCEDTGTTENDQPTAMLPDCCACGTAKYQITFHGLWSRNTHPKDYPTHRALLHWSNIVGASHSKDYTVWQYGDYASPGVKEVCEFGYPRKMEEEMRQHSGDVRTVIKTPGIWWKDPEGLLQTRWARFSVDRRHHLLSMLTMIGPSPDWCVGVSALNLCLPNCTWAGDKFIDLYPWDAGTDDGVSYMSANQKSDPPQKIHRITNTFPNNPSSPFNSAEPIRPLARLELKRLHPKPGSTVLCTGDDDEDFHHDAGDVETSEDVDFASLSEMEKQKLMLMQSGKCGLSPWSDWSECSVTCGVGQKVRKRMYHNPMVDEAMCGQPTMELENCIGVENECGDIAPGCEATHWAEWSPCSATCGQGVQDRTRYYLDKVAGMGCDRTMAEQQTCFGPDCDKARMMLNITSICSQPMSKGNCRGTFERWYFDTAMQKCLPFEYTGCRGNDNRFRTQFECMDMCVQGAIGIPQPGGLPRDGSPEVEFPRVGELSDEEIKKQMMEKQLMMEKQQMLEKQMMMEKQKLMEMEKQRQMEEEQRKAKEAMMRAAAAGGSSDHPAASTESAPVDCAVTPWSAWSACSASCGKSFKYRQRIIQREAAHGGKKCPRRLERKKRCEVPKCALDCVLGEWSEWTPCLQSCVQERTRRVVSRPRRGGAPCEARLSRRTCAEYPCLRTGAGSNSKDERRKRKRRRRQH